MDMPTVKIKPANFNYKPVDAKIKLPIVSWPKIWDVESEEEEEKEREAKLKIQIEATAMSGIVRKTIDKFDQLLKAEPIIDASLTKLKSKTGIKRKFLAGCVIIAVFMALLLRIGENSICKIFGFLYPAYSSIKAIESNDKKDNIWILTYWVVYSTFSFMDIFVDTLLFGMPFYYLLKFMFLLWCMHPRSRGADFIYRKLIKPSFMENLKKIKTLYSDCTVVLALLLIIAENCMCKIFGFIYPTYSSIDAIESDDTEDDRRLLTYWVVYSMFSFIEIFVDSLLILVPFYYLLKFAFLLWCMHPRTRGTDFIYRKFFRPSFRKNSKKIDTFLKITGKKSD